MNKEQKKRFLLSVILCSLSFGLYYSSGEQSSLIPQSVIEADSNGGTKETIYIDAITEDVVAKNISIDISPADYTDEELEDILFNNIDEIYNKVLASNEEFDNIHSNLDFFSSIKDLPFTFEWKTEDEKLIDEKGQIKIAEEFDSYLFLNVGYKSFSYDLCIPIHVNPGTFAKEIINQLYLEDYVKKNIKNNAMQTNEKRPSFALPGDMGGKKITYYYSGKKRNPLYLMLGPLASVLVLFGSKYDSEKEQKERIRKILSEYPSMVQKMSLYLTSGMTIRNIWLKLCDEAEAKGKELSPLYYEMKISANELQNSVSEGMVYIRFGERIKNTEIVRFSALLSQNLKKGSSRLSYILDEEAGKAFELRKQRAIKKGEEAGTKLLLPMMLLLLDVLVMIMIPAFWNM